MPKLRLFYRCTLLITALNLLPQLALAAPPQRSATQTFRIHIRNHLVSSNPPPYVPVTHHPYTESWRLGTGSTFGLSISVTSYIERTDDGVNDHSTEVAPSQPQNFGTAILQGSGVIEYQLPIDRVNSLQSTSSQPHLQVITGEITELP